MRGDQIAALKERAVGRWTDILLDAGIDRRFLRKRNGPCPMCGGKDRFRFSDFDRRGSYYCSGCGSGQGLDLMMRALRLSLPEALDILERAVGSAPPPKRETRKGPSMADRAVEIWEQSLKLAPGDPVMLYLASRSIYITLRIPTELRYCPSLPYWDEGEDGRSKIIGRYPAMVARFVDPPARRAGFQYLYLTLDGKKADVPKPRKFAAGMSKLRGGAVRLMKSAETMGIAEGIETAYSAAWHDGIPVWAALDANGLSSWEPPEHVKSVIVYGDNDASFTGQAHAYMLAQRLALQNRLHVEVRIPDTVGDDWNDVHASLAQEHANGKAA